MAPPRGAGLRGPESPGQSFGGRGESPEKRVRSGKERVNGSGSPRSGSHTPLPRAGLTHPGLGPAPRHPRAARVPRTRPEPPPVSPGGPGGMGGVPPPAPSRAFPAPAASRAGPAGTPKMPNPPEPGRAPTPRGPGALAAPAGPRPLRQPPRGCSGGVLAEPAARDGEGMTSAHYSAAVTPWQRSRAIPGRDAPAPRIWA